MPPKGSVKLPARSDTAKLRATASLVLMMLVAAGPAISMVPNATADPGFEDSGNMTRSVFWNFTDPADYTMDNATIASGLGMLAYLNESAAEDSSASYILGSGTNIDAQSYTDSIVIDNTSSSTVRVVLQPGPEGVDTYIQKANPNTNYDGGDLKLNGESATPQRILMVFNLSTIPSSAVVLDAKLYLYLISGKPTAAPYKLYALNTTFVEAEVSWNKYDQNNAWTNPGGDYSDQFFSQGTIPNEKRWHVIEMSRLVDLWVSGSIVNRGFIIVPEATTTDSTKAFASSDQATPVDQRPKLIVNYTVPNALGVYESRALGPGTDSMFTLANWSSEVMSLATDEFSGTTLSSRWSWWNDPAKGGGSSSFARPGWLRITGGAFTGLNDALTTCNFLNQNVTGAFELTTGLEEYFTADTMGAGLLMLNDNLAWIAFYKTGLGANSTLVGVVTDGGVSSTVVTVPWENETAAFLRLERTSSGHVRFLSSHDGSAWSLQYTFTPYYGLMTSVRVGVCVFSGPTSSNPVADFDFVRIEPPSDPTTFALRARLGNSTSLTDPSWGSWGTPLPSSSGSMIGATARYVQYQIMMTTTAPWVSPRFSGFSCRYERFAPVGVITTGDYLATDFQIWESMVAVHSAGPGSLEYYYSTDHGGSWVRLGTATSYSLLISSPSIMLRVVITSADTLATPTVDSITLVYRMAISSFYVTAPDTVVAGEPFPVTIEAKDSANETATQWSGTVLLHATDATGTGPATEELQQTLAVVPPGGIVTVSNERYDRAEVIRVLVTGGGASGLSGPITVMPGAVSSIILEPNDTTMHEWTSKAFFAKAYDAFGNLVQGAPFAWSADPSLGTLNTTTGDTVLLSVGDHFTSGYLNVTSGSVTVSRFIEVSPVLFAPEISSSIPTQVKPEDFGRWELNISGYVSDVEDTDDELRWYITQEQLVTVSGENRTGNMVITFNTREDMFGSDVLNLVVVDSDGMSASRTILVELTAVNDPPTIEPIDPLVVKAGVTYIFNFEYYIHDVDTPVSGLSLSLDSVSEQFCTVDRLFVTFTYPMAYLDTTQTVIVTVSDGEHTSATAVVVRVTSDTPPRVKSGMDELQVNQGQTLAYVYDLDEYFEDADADLLYYVSGNDHVIVDILSDHRVNITGPMDWYGVETVVFRAIDPTGARAELGVRITVIQVNQPPALLDLPDIMVRYDERYEFDLTPYVVEDEPIDELDLTVDDLHGYFVGPVLSLLYPMAMNGSRVTINITVSDGEFSVTNTMNVTVTDNHPPRAVATLPAHTFQEDVPVAYPIGGSLDDFFDDYEDGGIMAFTAATRDPHIEVRTGQSPVTGAWSVYFTVEENYNGWTSFTVRAWDTMGAITERSVPLSLMPVPDAPVIDLEPEIVVTEGEHYVMDMRAPRVVDVDSSFENGDFSFQVRLAEQVTQGKEHYLDGVQILPSVIVFEFERGFVGSAKQVSFKVEVRVTDQDGKVSSDILTVTVKKAPGESSTALEVAFLLSGAVTGGLLFVIFTMRKKPFVIRDMMLVHNDGFLIGRHAGHQVEGEIDQDILSGMLTAVLNFVEDSMATSQEQLKTFGFKDYQVVVKRGTMAYAAVVFEGDLPDSIEESLGKFLATFERIYRKKLVSWTGDFETDFTGVEVLIQGFVKEHSRHMKGKPKKSWVSNSAKPEQGAK